jgi:hypothetical protein
MYNIDPKPFMVRVAEDTQLYQIIRVEGMKLIYEARTATGDVYDSFVLEKTIGESNQIFEGKVDSQERRRTLAPPTKSIIEMPVVPVPSK